MKPVIKRSFVWAGVILVVLLIPAVMMRVSKEFRWDLSNFITMRVVLTILAVIYKIVAGGSRTTMYRIAAGTGLAGALLAGFKPWGMARTLFAATATQILVPVVGLILRPPPETSRAPGIPGLFLLSAFFAVLFLISGLFFRCADRNSSEKPL